MRSKKHHPLRILVALCCLSIVQLCANESFVASWPCFTTIDLSHLLKNNDGNSTLKLIVELKNHRFAEKEETRVCNIRLSEEEYAEVPIRYKTRPGDEGSFQFCFIYTKNREQKDHLVISFGFHGAGQEAEEASCEEIMIDESEKARIGKLLGFPPDSDLCFDPVIQGPAYSTFGVQIKATYKNLSTGIQFSQTIASFKEELESDKQLGKELVFDKSKAEEIIEEHDENEYVSAILQELNFDQIDATNIGLEKLNFDQIQINQDNKTFAGLENIGFEKLDFSKLNLSKVGLEKVGVRHRIVAKAIAKYLSFNSLIQPA